MLYLREYVVHEVSQPNAGRLQAHVDDGGGALVIRVTQVEAILDVIVVRVHVRISAATAHSVIHETYKLVEEPVQKLEKKTHQA